MSIGDWALTIAIFGPIGVGILLVVWGCIHSVFDEWIPNLLRRNSEGPRAIQGFTYHPARWERNDEPVEDVPLHGVDADGRRF